MAETSFGHEGMDGLQEGCEGQGRLACINLNDLTGRSDPTCWSRALLVKLIVWGSLLEVEPWKKSFILFTLEEGFISLPWLESRWQ